MGNSTSYKKGQVQSCNWTGRHHTKETKGKMSETKMGKCREESNNWKGGFTTHSEGYIVFKVPRGCRFSCMGNHDGDIFLHRLVMAEYLQRPLSPEEVVHHINGDVTDNRIENLRLFKNNSEHIVYHYKLKGGRNNGKIQQLCQ